MGALSLLAQQTLTGTVHDPQGTAVPFAVIELPAQQQGVQADEAGRFSLPLPAAVTPHDSLTVTALGYRPRRVVLPNSTASFRLMLEPLPVSLREVVVRAAPTLVLGPTSGNFNVRGYSQTGLSTTKNTGWQIARYFPTTAPVTLTEARFFVKKKNIGSCKDMHQAPFRVRVYAADGPGISPGTDLLTESVLAAATQPGWIVVDLRRFGLTAPAGGFFVAMEWVYTDDKYLCTYPYTDPTSKQKKQRTMYGQVLGGLTQPGAVVWYRSAGHQWRQMIARTMPNGQEFSISDPAIQAVVQP
ncbi:carboxypeptidase regulatory-like domain-containing protein [Hymenobacter seoulensis]